MKVVSYCIYGNNEKYTHGIIEAVISSKLIFTGWEIYVYASIGKQKVPDKLIEILKSLNCKVIELKETNGCGGEDIEPMYWRFYPLGYDNVDVWLSRDADSRASYRELDMVNNWLESGKAIHSILDHPCHGNLMGCNFGINNKVLREKYPSKIINMHNYIPQLAERKALRRGTDQNWVFDHFKSTIVDSKDILVHLQNSENCIKRCHIAGRRPIMDHYPCVLTEPPVNKNGFCGKQVNYSVSDITKPFIMISTIKLD